MKYSKRVTTITQKHMVPLMVDLIFAPQSEMLKNMLASMPKTKITWQYRFYWKYIAPVKNYFSFLWEAITNSHRCDTNDWD